MKVNIHLGLPDVFGEDREVHAWGVVNPEACETSSEVAVFAHPLVPLP